ncbi:MAG: Leucyl/phenylalanyl-tRNA--protein transferase [Alphaproteobacteria bacterium MarineAlpha11_Bin1]|nr:MAG: Leucyl/phenylalanyl-tRNA--protein transferase [Alphaproteobacteria bacterium MarineAlpha11_Bin1]|tara:strand:+ start:2515 stop:3165 length:651 start_codon:yes stop_codon:yes gene_type:complete
MTKLTPEIILRAYAVGLFPMAENRQDTTLYWIDPEKRGVLPLNDFHIPRRLRRTVRAGTFEVYCNTAFTDVIRGCAAPGAGRDESWINEEIISLYTMLNKMGRAYSVEAWHNGKLVGGLYGVALGAVFFGESMFSTVRDASKVALVHLVARLKKGKFTLLDTQFVNRHLAQFGVVEMPRSGFRQKLSSALDRSAIFPTELRQSELEDFLQSTTHTS